MAHVLGGFQHGEFLGNFPGVDSVVLLAEIYSFSLVHVSRTVEWYDRHLQPHHLSICDETQKQVRHRYLRSREACPTGCRKGGGRLRTHRECGSVLGS